MIEIKIVRSTVFRYVSLSLFTVSIYVVRNGGPLQVGFVENSIGREEGKFCHIFAIFIVRKVLIIFDFFLCDPCLLFDLYAMLHICVRE